MTTDARIKTQAKAKARILKAAITQTEKVHNDLDVAAGELRQTNAVLAGSLSAARTRTAVAGAVAQNKAAEAKVQGAADDLEEVTALLKDAQAAVGSPGGNSGEGSDSVVPYLQHHRK